MASLLIDALSTGVSPAKAAALEILATIPRTGAAMLEGHRACFGLLWHNPNATPAEILAELGTDAAAVFQRGADLVEFLLTKGIASMDPAEYTPPQAYTAHQDGTVTIQ